MFTLIRNGSPVPFLIEPSAHEGVRRVAGKVAQDVHRVSGMEPEIIGSPEGECVILGATLGCSPLADALIAAGKLPEAGRMRGKWECWLTALVDAPFAGVEKALVILGSDKRGTIYGLYSLSEYIGVSPLHYWGDAEPLPDPEPVIGEDFLTVTKEPSVRYRGLFINDEWPCFGSWAMSHFGGVNAQMYDHVFDLLLRLKGNYMWPAMWASVFGEEGPGAANEELADIYGIVVGNSHHEPCLRAGEEFKHSIQRENAKYGTDWNFVRNREGITRFWADGLKRSGKYEHLITIGMRGEADSAMLGEDAGLRGNIEYLKDVITTQEQLIAQYAGPKSKDQPRLLALYKEVEPFFYGNENVPGLKDWEGLTNTVCMLCEDNQGFMRSLPTPETTASLKARGCGWGMYYHVDYHGGPVSYEWMPSTPFSLLWEQMCLAYDYGVRDVWILNTGDLKFNEVSLKQFLDLAYDYDRWGSHMADNWQRWLTEFVRSTFRGLPQSVQGSIQALLTGLYDINGMRRPEALNAAVYHPCHHLEAHRMMERAESMLRLCQNTMTHCRRHAAAFYSMVGYPVTASMNLLRMHLASGLNAHYARQGRPKANFYADMVQQTLEADRTLGEKYAAWKDGKWRGMEREEHIGFTGWNEDGCRMPLRTLVTPMPYPRLSLSRKDGEDVVGRKYGAPAVIRVHDFCDAGVDEVILEAANDGTGELTVSVEGEADWLTILVPQEEQKTFLGGRAAKQGLSFTVKELEEIRLICDRDALEEEEQQLTLVIRSTGEGSHAQSTVHVDVRARKHPANADAAFMPAAGVVTIDAHHFAREHAASGAAFRVLPGYGRSGQAVKVYPSTAAFVPGGDAPALTYRFHAEAEGEYACELWLTPTSPVQPGAPMRCMLTGPDGAQQLVTCVAADYRPGENSDPRWCAAMVEHIRRVKTVIRCEKGVNELTIGAVDPNLSLERLVIHPVGLRVPESYLGAPESMVK